MDGNRHARIAKRAYELWEGEGKPEGCDLAHWLRAEAELNKSPPARIEAGRVPATVARKKKTKSSRKPGAKR